MSFSDYLVYSLLGIAVVFFALILLMVIIKVITIDKKGSKKEASAEAESAAEAVKGPAAKGTAGDLLLYDTDDRTAAMLMAIVADEMKTPLNELRFISIKEVK